MHPIVSTVYVSMTSQGSKTKSKRWLNIFCRQRMLGRGVNVGQILRFGQVSLQVVRAFPSGSNLVERVTVWEWINNETKDVEVTDHRRGVKKTTSSQNFMLDLCPLIDKIACLFRRKTFIR